MDHARNTMVRTKHWYRARKAAAIERLVVPKTEQPVEEECLDAEDVYGEQPAEEEWPHAEEADGEQPAEEELPYAEEAGGDGYETYGADVLTEALEELQPTHGEEAPAAADPPDHEPNSDGTLPAWRAAQLFSAAAMGFDVRPQESVDFGAEFGIDAAHPRMDVHSACFADILAMRSTIAPVDMSDRDAWDMLQTRCPVLCSHCGDRRGGFGNKLQFIARCCITGYWEVALWCSCLCNEQLCLIRPCTVK